MPIYSDYPHDKPAIPVSYKPLEGERKILDLWADHDAKPRPVNKYYYEAREEAISFAYGPPFPTGTPHSGHVLNAILKDTFYRYAQQRYLQEKSKLHWDCHGLPVEHEVDKKLGIKCAADIHKIGIAEYNAECRKFLVRHETDWKNVFNRIGVRTDFNNTFSAMTAESMERVWGVFKRLYDKGLVYRDTKVLPYSTACVTHLSDFEADQKSADVTELGVTIALHISDSKEKLLVWIVGPWRLAVATAICVNPSARYVKVKVPGSGDIYIVSKSRLTTVFPNPSEYTPLAEFDGEMLKDLHCLGLNEHYQEHEDRLRILTDESIPDDVGTGIAAISPYFGEADHRISKENGIQFDEHDCPLDDSGRFKECVPKLSGLPIFEANTAIVESLQRRGCLFCVENITHKRHFCWRSDTPLIDKLVSTWFVRTKDLGEQIIENSSKVNWVFSDGHGIMKNSVRKFNDWAVGRRRFWGTPIPIWTSPSGDEVVCVGSIKELLKLTGLSCISDLHREFVDDLRIKSKVPGNPPLRRVSGVFDCWFEASVFAREDEDRAVDRVIEGSDQYNGWFYTTTVLSAALCLPPLSKNVLVHGLVETSKGEKMSKRMHNHTDPLRIIEKHGADAFRLYLLTTPLVSGANFALEEQCLPQVTRIFAHIYIVLRHIVPHFGKAGCISYGIFNSLTPAHNVFDRWILSRTERLVQFYETGMTAFRPQGLVLKIIKHLDVVVDVYMPIRQGKRINDKDAAMMNAVLYDILYKFTIVLSPLAPFFTEHIYQIIKPWVAIYPGELVCSLRPTDKATALVVKDVEEKVDCWRMVVGLVRELRRMYVIPIQYRISELILISPIDISFKDDEFLNETLLEVVNVHRISITHERSKFGVELRADLRADSSLHQTHSVFKVGEIASKIQQLNDNEVEELIRNKSVGLNEELILLEDIQISCKVNKELEKKQAVSTKNELVAIIRMNKDFDYYEEGTRLGLVHSVIKFRKKCKVYPSEEAIVCYSTKDDCMRHAFEKYTVHLKESTNSIMKPLQEVGEGEEEGIQMEVDIMGVPVELRLYKGEF